MIVINISLDSRRATLLLFVLELLNSLLIIILAQKVVSWRLSVRLSVNSTGRATLDTDASATQNFLSYYFNDFRAISVCWLVAEIFLVLMWGPHFCGGPCSAEHAEHA